MDDAVATFTNLNNVVFPGRDGDAPVTKREHAPDWITRGHNPTSTPAARPFGVSAAHPCRVFRGRASGTALDMAEQVGTGFGVAHARGTCDTCGSFRVRATSVTVRQRLDDGTWSYRVQCPHCRCSMVAPTTCRVALQLLVAQAPLEPWTLPAHALGHTGAAPIAADDLDALHADLERTDVVDLLRASLDTV